MKHDPDHPKAISFIVGVEAREEFVLCYSDDQYSFAEYGIRLVLGIFGFLILQIIRLRPNYRDLRQISKNSSSSNIATRATCCLNRKRVISRVNLKDDQAIHSTRGVSIKWATN
mgnify:CR=1 FL=1